jgi:hypothetical protein
VYSARDFQDSIVESHLTGGGGGEYFPKTECKPKIRIVRITPENPLNRP